MRPIEQRTDAAFGQALKCLSFRIPGRDELSEPSFQLAIGLRYGLFGAAAAQHLFLSCPDREEQALAKVLLSYRSLVRDHMESVVIPKLGLPPSRNVAERVAEYASESIEQFLPLYRQLCPVELGLSVLSDHFTESHRKEIIGSVNWFKRGGERRTFQRFADQSFNFALAFFERRQLDIEEVREIALIGE